MVDTIKQIKVIGYCRVSDIKQLDSGHSIEAQKQIIKQYCANKGFKLVKTYVEQLSGSTSCLDRQEFKKIIVDLSNNKASGLVCTKFDRLSRDLKDLLMIIDKYFKKYYDIYFTDFDQVDLSTMEGRMQLQLFGAFSELERGMIAKRTKQVLDLKKSKSEKLGGRIPYGFMVKEITENGKIIKKLVNNPEEAALINDLRQLRNTEKLSYKDLADKLIKAGFKNRNGLVKWNPSQVLKMAFPELCPKKIKKKKEKGVVGV